MRPLAILGVGARTPVGPGAHETFFSVRTRLSSFRESFVIDHTGEHVVISAIPPAVPQLGEEGRLLELGLPALSEALKASVGAGRRRQRVGLVLVTPDPAERPRHWSFPSAVVRALVSLLPEPLPGSGPLLVPGGHTGWAQALEQASQMLGQGQADECVVGAVDTLCAPRTLEHLDRLQLLRNEEKEDGMIPGEAAAFLVLGPRLSAPPERPPAFLASWADSAPLPDERPLLPGAVLTRATRECLRRGGEREAAPGLIVSDMGGEKQDALEVAFARFRAFRDQASTAELFHPSECLGDVGAATGPLLMVLATLYSRHGGGPRGDALLTTSSRSGRCAVGLIRPERS